MINPKRIRLDENVSAASKRSTRSSDLITYKQLNDIK